MLLKKIRIKNYRSIIDSGVCDIEKGVTILAGKNESGKTSILEALEDFDSKKEIRKESIPLKTKDALPEIILTVLIESKTFEEIFSSLGASGHPGTDIELSIKKKYPKEYSFDRESLEKSKLFDSVAFNDLISQILKNWDQLNQKIDQFPQIPKTPFKLNFLVSNKYSQAFAEYSNQINGVISQFPPGESPDIGEELNFLSNSFKRVEEATQLEADVLSKLISEYIPNFVLFKSFEDIFPTQIPLSELQTNSWIADLREISSLNPALIQSGEAREKKAHKVDLNIRVNEDYKTFWSQDVSGLSIDWDSEKLYFWVLEDGMPYEISYRSKGRQWHLAFYIRITARAEEKVPNIILIDEPGLFLHAKAQADILKKLEDSSRLSQIIFSTHSPYLIESEKLGRIRLVVKNSEKGTYIENKIQVVSDKETLTPILTAIGLDVTSGITDMAKVNNIIVEGMSDYYYLSGFKKVFDWKSANFIFGGGSGNMPIVGTVLHGWGANVIYLFDNDQGKDDGERNLEHNWYVSSDFIETVLKEKGSIEDVFTNTDFAKLVVGNDAIKIMEKTPITFRAKN